MYYNYQEAVKSDVLDYINNEINYKDFDDIDALSDELNERLWIEDSVTGNASGSYTFNTAQAWDNLNGNIDLLEDCASEFGFEPTISAGYEHGAEWWDVSIRCYLLGGAIAEALEEIADDFDKAHEEEGNQ